MKILTVVGAALLLLSCNARTGSGKETSNGTSDDTLDGCSLLANMTGDWVSTLWGDVTIADQYLDTQTNLGNTGVTRLHCEQAADNGDLILTSTKFHKFAVTVNFSLVMCINLSPRNKDNFHVIIKTGQEAGLNNEPVTLVTASQPLNASILCQSDPDLWLHGDMVRKGNESTATAPCPGAITGNHVLDYSSDDLISRCPNGAKMTSCGLAEGSLLLDYRGCGGEGNTSINGSDVFGCIGGKDNEILLFDVSNSNFSFSCARLIPHPSDNSTFVFELTPGGCGYSWVQGSAEEVMKVTATLHSTGHCPTTPSPTTPATTPLGTTTLQDLLDSNIDNGNTSYSNTDQDLNDTLHTTPNTTSDNISTSDPGVQIATTLSNNTAAEPESDSELHGMLKELRSLLERVVNMVSSPNNSTEASDKSKGICDQPGANLTGIDCTADDATSLIPGRSFIVMMTVATFALRECFRY